MYILIGYLNLAAKGLLYRQRGDMKIYILSINNQKVKIENNRLSLSKLCKIKFIPQSEQVQTGGMEMVTNPIADAVANRKSDKIQDGFNLTAKLNMIWKKLPNIDIKNNIDVDRKSMYKFLFLHSTQNLYKLAKCIYNDKFLSRRQKKHDIKIILGIIEDKKKEIKSHYGSSNQLISHDYEKDDCEIFKDSFLYSNLVLFSSSISLSII